MSRRPLDSLNRRPLEIVSVQASALCNSGEHSRADLLVIVECEYDVGPVRAFERAVRAGLAFDSPPNA